MKENNSNIFGPLKRSAPTKEAIAERAYELWEQQGREYGKHLENWREAERELSGLGRSEWHGVPPVTGPEAPSSGDRAV